MLIGTLLSAIMLAGCNVDPDPDPAPPEVEDQDPADEDRNDPNDLSDNTEPENGDNQTRLEVADEAADQIAELDEVERANVIVTNQNAYVAVVLRDGAKGEVTDRIENNIANQVKATDPDIQNVYVSSNPDFVDRMKDYGERISEGDPIEGLFEEFNEMVRRVFPNER